MSDANRKVVRLDSLNVKSRGRGKGTKKLPEWVPFLSWHRPFPTEAMEHRHYTWKEEDLDAVIASRQAALAKQHEKADKIVKILNDRKIFVQTVKETKEVRIKL